jgi:hypothetical protein
MIMQFIFPKAENAITLNFQKEKITELPAGTNLDGYDKVGEGLVRRKPFTFNYVPANPIEVPEAFLEAVLLDVVKADLREFVVKGEQYPGVNMGELLLAYVANNRGQRKFSKEWLMQNAADFKKWLDTKLPNQAASIAAVVEKNFKPEDVLQQIKVIDKIVEVYSRYLAHLGDDAEALQFEFIEEAIKKVEAVKKPKTIEEFDVSGIE